VVFAEVRRRRYRDDQLNQVELQKRIGDSVLFFAHRPERSAQHFAHGAHGLLA